MSFKQIFGQEQPKQIIKNALQNSSLAHAYLFYGQESIGKKLIAFELAKTLNCTSIFDGEACDECSSCKKIENRSWHQSFSETNILFQTRGPRSVSQQLSPKKIPVQENGSKSVKRLKAEAGSTVLDRGRNPFSKRRDFARQGSQIQKKYRRKSTSVAKGSYRKELPK